MNNIKPQWVITGFIAVGALWLMETDNRPGTISGNSSSLDHLASQESRVSSPAYQPVSSPPVDALSEVDQQVAEKKATQSLTARMLVASRGEFFAYQSMALPAQEQALLVDMVHPQALSVNVGETEKSCVYKNCIGLSVLDF